GASEALPGAIPFPSRARTLAPLRGPERTATKRRILRSEVGLRVQARSRARRWQPQPTPARGPGALRGEEEGGRAQARALDVPGDLRPDHAGHRRLHAADRLHGPRRLEGLLRFLPDVLASRPLLADPHHALRREG